MKIPQHKDPDGFYFELSVPGASAAELERGVKAAWDYFLAAGVQPWFAVAAEHLAEKKLIGDPPIADSHLVGMWVEAQQRAIQACCRGWPVLPTVWVLGLVESTYVPA